MGSLLFLLVVWGIAAAVGSLREVPRLRPMKPGCIACGYSLEGLAASGACPECGTAFSQNGQPRMERTFRVAVTRPGLMVFTMLVLLLAAFEPTITQWGLFQWVEAEALIHRGYRADVAWRAVTMPQFGGCGTQRGGVSTSPGVIGAAVLPLVGLLPG